MAKKKNCKSCALFTPTHDGFGTCNHIMSDAAWECLRPYIKKSIMREIEEDGVVFTAHKKFGTDCPAYREKGSEK